MRNTSQQQIQLIKGEQRKNAKDKNLIDIEILDETDIYTDEGLASYCEDDLISSEEAGFMQGYLSA